tara:strand:- start:522 stop:716 length:195 start_codon:yes stop_codon:yes gene_type:complete
MNVDQRTVDQYILMMQNGLDKLRGDQDTIDEKLKTLDVISELALTLSRGWRAKIVQQHQDSDRG